MLQRACEIQVATLGMGRPIVVSDEVVAVNQRDMAQLQHPDGAGTADFAAWMRKLDRVDRNWRD